MEAELQAILSSITTKENHGENGVSSLDAATLDEFIMACGSPTRDGDDDDVDSDTGTESSGTATLPRDFTYYSSPKPETPTEFNSSDVLSAISTDVVNDDDGRAVPNNQDDEDSEDTATKLRKQRVRALISRDPRLRASQPLAGPSTDIVDAIVRGPGSDEYRSALFEASMSDGLRFAVEELDAIQEHEEEEALMQSVEKDDSRTVEEGGELDGKGKGVVESG